MSHLLPTQPSVRPSRPTQPEQESTLSSRSLVTSALLTVCTTLVLFGANHSAWAWGFLIGALLSLFSLFTFVVLVPFLFRPNAPRFASTLLTVVLIMKLPLFALVLYLLTHLHGVAPAASVFGIVLGPAVISLKALSGLTGQQARVRRSVNSDVAQIDKVSTPI